MTITHDAAFPPLDIDISRSFNLDAGKCEKCGYFKTWGFRVLNPKSGKMMPGHVTAEGYKLGDGNCPFWLVKNDTNHSKFKKTPATGEPLPLDPAKVENPLVLNIAGKPFLLDRKQAIDLLKQLVDQMA